MVGWVYYCVYVQSVTVTRHATISAADCKVPVAQIRAGNELGRMGGRRDRVPDIKAYVKMSPKAKWLRQAPALQFTPTIFFTENQPAACLIPKINLYFMPQRYNTPAYSNRLPKDGTR